ncbi:hypothetical protein VNO77_34670 [Canavalia gladiata]|uniref:Uncharacterized protein n=1 Tax=Canavalia gladiata TaxID=3824 RepID=A0AAN9Q003_CANGL
MNDRSQTLRRKNDGFAPWVSHLSKAASIAKDEKVESIYPIVNRRDVSNGNSPLHLAAKFVNPLDLSILVDFQNPDPVTLLGFMLFLGSNPPCWRLHDVHSDHLSHLTFMAYIPFAWHICICGKTVHGPDKAIAQRGENDTPNLGIHDMNPKRTQNIRCTTEATETEEWRNHSPDPHMPYSSSCVIQINKDSISLHLFLLAGPPDTKLLVHPEIILVRHGPLVLLRFTHGFAPYRMATKLLPLLFILQSQLDAISVSRSDTGSAWR